MSFLYCASIMQKNCEKFQSLEKIIFIKAAPHNGARRFGQCFDPGESMENAGILDVFPIFHTARLGQKIRRSPLSSLCGVALGSQGIPRELPVSKEYFIHPRRGSLNCQFSIVNCQLSIQRSLPRLIQTRIPASGGRPPGPLPGAGPGSCGRSSLRGRAGRPEWPRPHPSSASGGCPG